MTLLAGLIQWDFSLLHTLMPQAPRASSPTEVLAGLVDRVTFHNAENGFCVLRVKVSAMQLGQRIGCSAAGTDPLNHT